jgi:hypothetical protein
MEHNFTGIAGDHSAGNWNGATVYSTAENWLCKKKTVNLPSVNEGK